MKNLICFLLIFNMVIPDMAYAEWEEATRMFKMSGREKRKQAKKYGCFDFSKPGKVAPSGKGQRGRVKKHRPGGDKKQEYADCTKEVMKERDEIKKDIDDVNKDLKSKIDKRIRKANKIVTKIDNDQADLRQDSADIGKRQSNYDERKNNKIDRKNARSKRAWIFGCIWFNWRNADKCGKGNRGTSKWEVLSDVSTNSKKRVTKRKKANDKEFDDRQADKLEEADELETTKVEKEEEELGELLGPVHEEMLAAYIEKKPDLAKKSEDEQLESLYKDKTFARKYIEENLPEVQDLVTKKKALQAQIDNLKVVAKEVCRNEQVACPAAKENFKNEPSLESFMEMISTVGTIYYSTDKNFQSSSFHNLNAQNYEQVMKEHGKHITNDKMKHKMEDNFEKAKDALDDLEFNHKNKDKIRNKEIEAKKINSACGSCRDLTQLYDQMKKSQDFAKFKELQELAGNVGCKVPDVAKKSCDEDSSGILNRNFSQDRKNFTLDQAIDMYLLQPDKASALLTSLDEIGILVEKSKETNPQKDPKAEPEESPDYAACPACEKIKNRLNDLSDQVSEEYEEEEMVESKVGGEIVFTPTIVKKSRNYRKPKKDADLKAFENLKSIALQIKSEKCIDANEFREDKPQNSCEEKTGFFKDLVAQNKAEADLTIAESTDISLHMDDLKKFQTENKVNCCEQVVGDLASDKLKPVTKAKASLDYLDMNSVKVKLAERMTGPEGNSCLACGGAKSETIVPNTVHNDNPHIKCDFYKKDIKGKDGNIQGLLKGDGKPYSIAEWNQNEVYSCQDGPKKSLINRGRDWETIAYSSEGKYADFAELDMKCYIDPTGETVNLTCCDMDKNSPEFARFITALDKSKNNLTTATGVNPPAGTGKASLQSWLKATGENAVNEQRAQSFCQDVWAKGYAADSSKRNDGWKVCVDYKNTEYWKVDKTKIELQSNGGASARGAGTASNGKGQ